MKILVQKFGGTSLATQEARQQVASKIAAAKKKGYSLVVVVSAIGRQGAPYATDTLISTATKENPDLSRRELDLLMSCGEIISGVIMVGVLQKQGYKAICLTGAQAGIITDDQHGDAHILRVETDRLLKLLKEDYIVVVTGFQGVTVEGEITTLGRGGSDTTAAALGVALDAEAIEIYTDVDGVKTADPRIVANAQTLKHVTYNEVCHLAYEGAKVIHPRAVEIAAQKNIPLMVKCTFSEGGGTLVTNARQTLEQNNLILNDRPVTGIAQTSGITQIRVKVNETNGFKSIAQVFSSLAKIGISVDLINILPELVAFTVKNEVADKAQKVLTEMGFSLEMRPGCAKVAVVGAGMMGVPGIMAAIAEALAEEGIEILQSVDSHTTIWCLVDEQNMERAVRILHDKFQLGTTQKEV